MDAANSQQPWFALQVRCRFEHKVTAALGGQDYECFLPLYKSRRRWSDRIKELELPLFPGYLFCRFNPQSRLPILKTPGVIGVVGIGGRPVPVDENEVLRIRKAVLSGVPAQPWPYLRIGERVRINYGSLYGVEGILVEVKGNYRVVLSVDLLQRSVALQVDRSWISPAGESRKLQRQCNHIESGREVRLFTPLQARLSRA